MFIHTDKQLTLFTSEGKLSQCDNALVASTHGNMSIGSKSEDGVVIASLKESTSFIILEEYPKVYSISKTIGCTYSGLQPDFRIQHNIALKIVNEYKDIYNKEIPIQSFIETFSRQIQEYTIKKGYRPFGTLILVCGDNLLYRIDPSGSYQTVNVGCIGKEYVESKRLLEKRRGCLDDNISTCVECIRQYAGKSISSKEVDIGIYRNGKFSRMSQEEVQEVFDSINKVY